MRPVNMPYYRGPRIQQPMMDSDAADNLHAGNLLTELITSNGCSPTHFSNIPVRFGFMKSSAQANYSTCILLNSKFSCYPREEAAQFNWAVYTFSNGHFISSIDSRQLPFTISLACDTTEQGRSLFHEFATNAKVFSSGNDFQHHICALNDQAIVNCYLINSYCLRTSEVTSSFWKQLLSIIAQLCVIRSLSVKVAIVIVNHDGRAIKSFIRGLNAAHWKVSSRATSYLNIGDLVAESCLIITAVHSSSASDVDPLVLKPPPSTNARLLCLYIWEPFNHPEHSLCYGHEDKDFNKDETCQMTTTTPKPTNNLSPIGIVIKYHLHRNDSNESILAGSSVLSKDRPCPRFESFPNQNLVFEQYFGLKFHHDCHTYVCAISTNEFTRCFNLIEKIQNRLSHKQCKFGLGASMPGFTSAWLFEQVHSHLVYLRDLNSKTILPNQFAAPAARIQTLVNGAVRTRLPSRKRWVQAYTSTTPNYAPSGT